MDNDDAGTLNV